VVEERTGGSDDYVVKPSQWSLGLCADSNEWISARVSGIGAQAALVLLFERRRKLNPEQEVW
jgi:hypothetical protein